MITEKNKQLMIFYAKQIYKNKKQSEDDALEKAINKYNHEVEVAKYELTQGIKQIEKLA